MTRKKANIAYSFKKEHPRNERPVSLTSVPGKILEQAFKEPSVKHLEENQVIRNSHHGFTKSQSCLANLISLDDKVIGSVTEGIAVNLSLAMLLTQAPLAFSFASQANTDWMKLLLCAYSNEARPESWT